MNKVTEIRPQIRAFERAKKGVETTKHLFFWILFLWMGLMLIQYFEKFEKSKNVFPKTFDVRERGHENQQKTGSK